MSIEFDFHGLHWVLTPAVRETMTEVVEREGAMAAFDALRDEMTRQARRDPSFRNALRASYDNAGVALRCATLLSTSPNLSYPEGIELDRVRWEGRFDAIPWLHRVRTPDDARAFANSGEYGILLGIQNLGDAVGRDVEGIDRLYDSGVRVMQLTYNYQNSIGTGCTDRSDAGLSNFGTDAVERMNELGAIIDLSHCGHRTTLDAIEHSTAPVAFTHTSCEAVTDHDRAKSDEELRALAAKDGYVGILTVPWFLAQNDSDPDLEIFFEHVEHAVSVVGVDRVGIGTDFGLVDSHFPEELAPGFRDYLAQEGFREEHGVGLGDGFDRFGSYGDWNVLREGLQNRLGDADTRKILGENFLDFWERVQS